VHIKGKFSKPHCPECGPKERTQSSPIVSNDFKNKKPRRLVAGASLRSDVMTAVRPTRNQISRTCSSARREECHR
jgi:hypothetical protein